MAKGGRTFNDRQKSAEVRNEVLDNIMLVLTDDPAVSEWSDLKKQMVLKMAPNTLPRLNEHSGPSDDEGQAQPLLVKIIGQDENNGNTS